jgi:hypothetical protein
MTALLLAGAWCALTLAGQLALAKAQGRPRAFAPAAGGPNPGSPQAGSRYAFTGAMLPWAKESVRMNPGGYALGLTMHAGLFAALASLVLRGPAGSSLSPVQLAAVALSAAGAAAGLGLLAKRLLQPHLRGLSNADDFVSNLLVTLTCTLAAAGSRLLPWAVTALLCYIPLGKLRHCVFFFLSRHHLGAFFGRRGVWPPTGSSHV